jgi:hypothetical protein
MNLDRGRRRHLGKALREEVEFALHRYPVVRNVEDMNRHGIVDGC